MSSIVIRHARQTISPAPMANVHHFCGVAMATMTAAMDRMKLKTCVLILDAHPASSVVAISSASLRQKFVTITRTAKTDLTKNLPSVRLRDFVCHISFVAEAAIALMVLWPVMGSTIVATVVMKLIAVARPSAVLANAPSCALKRREVITAVFVLLAMQPCRQEPTNQKHV